MKPKSIPSCTVKFEASYLRHAVQDHRLDHAVDLASMYIYIHIMQQEISGYSYNKCDISCRARASKFISSKLQSGTYAQAYYACTQSIQLAAMMYILTIANISQELKYMHACIYTICYAQNNCSLYYFNCYNRIIVLIILTFLVGDLGPPFLTGLHLILSFCMFAIITMMMHKCV